MTEDEADDRRNTITLRAWAMKDLSDRDRAAAIADAGDKVIGFGRFTDRRQQLNLAEAYRGGGA